MSYKDEIHESGTIVLTASNSSVAVTFAKAFTSGVTPVLIITAPYQTAIWYTNLTNAGFTLNVGTTNLYNQTFEYLALRPVVLS